MLKDEAVGEASAFPGRKVEVALFNYGEKKGSTEIYS